MGKLEDIIVTDALPHEKAEAAKLAELIRAASKRFIVTQLLAAQIQNTFFGAVSHRDNVARVAELAEQILDAT